VRRKSKLIADTFEKRIGNHISININKKLNKFKEENKREITNEPEKQAIPLCDREKSSKCQQKKVESTFITLPFTSTYLEHSNTETQLEIESLKYIQSSVKVSLAGKWLCMLLF
jgi:hypothetical protein